MSGLRLLFKLFYACCVFFAAWGQVCAQEQAVLERDAALLAEPRNGAAVLAQLKQGTSAEVIARKGAWVNLTPASGRGSLFSVGSSGGSVADPTRLLRGLFGC
jgi:hypothetical protein